MPGHHGWGQWLLDRILASRFGAVAAIVVVLIALVALVLLVRGMAATRQAGSRRTPPSVRCHRHLGARYSTPSDVPRVALSFGSPRAPVTRTPTARIAAATSNPGVVLPRVTAISRQPSTPTP